MTVYKVFYKSANGTEEYTFIEAEADYRKAKCKIKSVLHFVQGMNTELISFEKAKQESNISQGKENSCIELSG